MAKLFRFAHCYMVKWLRKATIIFANMIITLLFYFALLWTMDHRLWTENQLFRLALLWTMDRRLWTKKTTNSELPTKKLHPKHPKTIASLNGLTV